MSGTTERWSRTRDRVSRAAETGMARLPRRLQRLLPQLRDRDVLASASSLAFYGLVSALPLLLLTVGLATAVAGQDAVIRFVNQAPPSGAQGARQFLDQIARNGSAVTLPTVLFTLWPATAYGGGLRRALLTASGRDESIPRLRGRLRGLGLLLLLPALLLAGVPLAFVLTNLSGDGPLATVLGWLLALAGGTLLGGLVTTALYHAFSPQSLGWRETASGALSAAAATALFSVGFVGYLRVADLEQRFGGGTIGIVVLLGVWLFVANALLLAGYQAVLTLDDRES